MTDLRTGEYRDLLQAALPLVPEADTATPDLRTLFTPARHRLALDPDATVVMGERGVGKTVWFRAIQDPTLRELAAKEYQIQRLTKVEPMLGYGAELQPERYPGPAALASLVRGRVDPEAIWTVVLLNALGAPGIQGLPDWRSRVDWASAHPEARDVALAAADREAQARGVIRLFLFDALDRLHPNRQRADELVGGVLRLALELRTRTRGLRAKVFIRSDMYDSAPRHFPDASKLDATIQRLHWLRTDLYGLLFHLLGNVDHPLAEQFRASTGRWSEYKGGRHTPPPDLVGDEELQQEIFTRMAGQYMGTGYRKGHTYPWLPNHLMDGLQQVSPRSFLQALGQAAQVSQTQFAAYRFALHYEGIRQGVQAASRTRVAEVAEDIPWVAVAVEPLEGTQVPIEEERVIERWAASSRLRSFLEELGSAEVGPGSDETRVRTGPRYGQDYPGLIGELIELGVMSRRADRRLDLPDVYRIAFGIGRKGGVPRVHR